jgi:putative heme-binding domain-containing protein
VKDHRPAPGVVPFTVSARQWLDGATAEHFVALPGDAAVLYHESGKPVPGLVYWHNFRMHFPESAVLMRTLSLEDRRLETQLLHFEGGDWRAYTYVWRDDQADADLAPAEGAEKELNIGGRRRVWQVHSRSQCMSCHSNQSEYALAFLPEQLNRTDPAGRNQLVALTESGVIRRIAANGKTLPAFDNASVNRERVVADPTDEAQPLESRARGYLHANCGHCHSDHGGGAVPLRLQFQVPPADMHAIGVRPTRGNFGLANADIIKPGDPYASTLFFRMAKFGRDRMPHIGSELPDEAGLQLIEQWIAGLKGAAQTTAANPNGAEPSEFLVDPKSATILARRLGRGELKPAEKASLLAAAAKLPSGNVRDLFEGYLPADPTGQRKLGSNPLPQTILAHQGDAGRGEKLFWSEAVNCGKCHRLGDRGTAVGPELSLIGQTRSPADLLESLLTPSRRIEPKYAVYVVRTEDGRSLTGVLISRNAETVELRDNQGQAIVLEATSVQKLQPSRLSLMPDGQMAGLTAQEAADLLAYLATRKGDSAGTSRSP